MTVSQSTGPVSQPTFQDLLAGQTVAIDNRKTVKARFVQQLSVNIPLSDLTSIRLATQLTFYPACDQCQLIQGA